MAIPRHEPHVSHVPNGRATASAKRHGTPARSEAASERSITVAADLLIERILSLEIARVAESAAVSAALLRGLGNEIDADRAAVDAMRHELGKIPIRGTVVFGEGERDEAPMLFIGEEVGAGNGPYFDVAVDPLEGTALCAKNLPGAIAGIAIAERGTPLHAPDVYMEKSSFRSSGQRSLRGPIRRQSVDCGHASRGSDRSGRRTCLLQHLGSIGAVHCGQQRSAASPSWRPSSSQMASRFQVVPSLFTTLLARSKA